MTDIISFDKTDSTNTYAKQNMDFLLDRVVVAADLQTNGYGRFERSWVGLGPENIYMTFVLKPSDKLLPEYANLTQYLSVILCRKLESMGLSPQIKWPNDVLLNGKKVCGILAETVSKGGLLRGIALGIGANLNASVEALGQIDRPATSLDIELGHAINKQDFRQSFVEMFFADYDKFLNEGFECIRADYERLSLFHKGTDNTEIKVAVFNKIKHGIFKGFDENCNLLLLMADGKIKKFNMGEII